MGLSPDRSRQLCYFALGQPPLTPFMEHIKFYFERFLRSKDVIGMTTSEVGAYALLLFNSINQENKGYLPKDMDLIRKMTRLPNKQWQLSKTKLMKKFNQCEKGYYNEMMLLQVEKSLRKSANNSNAAKGRKKAAASSEVFSETKIQQQNKVKVLAKAKNDIVVQAVKPTKSPAVKEVKSVNNMMMEFHKLQDYVEKYFVNIKKIENQLTYKQCEMLTDKFSKELIISKLKKMENTMNISGKYSSVFITLEEWCKKDAGGNYGK